MDSEQGPSSVLNNHPIFSLPKSFSGPVAQAETSLELSTSTLPRFTNFSTSEDGPTPSGRRQVMVLKESDLIVAAGKELRMSHLGDTRLPKDTPKSYKTLKTPSIQFEIHQISLNPSGKLLAVAGAFQVAVVVLPRPGYSRLVPESIDCKSVQVGQFYHASDSAAPIAKIEWHPWGEAGSTLMVMTVDGKLREYDISMDTEEPQQVLSFVPDRKPGKSYLAEDPAEREVASFAFGKGRADWGPLTVYAVMKSGDIYSICPYMPQNTSIPSYYVHSLECFIAAKLEYLSQGNTSAASKSMTTLYDYQHKYVMALVKQLPAGTVFPAASRSVLMHPPTTIKSHPARQGPFLLQPAPRLLEGSEGGDATDIAYLTFGDDMDEDNDGDGGETEHLGVVIVAYQDGKVDVCLDVEKVEARWESKQFSTRELPMLAVYETIDLGLVSTLRPLSSSRGETPILDLLKGNHPVFLVDPIHDDTIYVYHAFGVHALHLEPVLQSLTTALRSDDDNVEASLNAALQISAQTTVQPILSTFSVERRCSNPVVALTVPDDVYLTYSIFILTSAMRITSFSLHIRSESPTTRPHTLPAEESPQPGSPETWLKPLDGPSLYMSLLGTEPYKPPTSLSRPSGLPSNPRLSLPNSGTQKKDFMLTPDTLRYLATTVAALSGQSHEIQLAHRGAEGRAALQAQELLRLCGKCRELHAAVEKLKGPRRSASENRFKAVQDNQKVLLARLDRMLQGLMEKASPELSEHETKWFEELKRMKEEIVGAGKYDEGSLVTRTRLLEREYERLMPNLKASIQKEAQRRDKLSESTRSLGVSQAFELGERSNFERSRLSEVEKDILQLAEKLEVTLGRPPSA